MGIRCFTPFSSVVTPLVGNTRPRQPCRRGSRLFGQMPPNATSELLVTNIDNAAAAVPNFDEVVQQYWQRVFRFVLASVRDVNEAECLTQDCFCKAYKAWNRFRGDSSVETWLMHIAVNVVRDFFRNRRLQFWRRAPVVDAAEIGCILM